MALTIRIAGEAGQGVATTGSILVGALAELGLHVAATRSYMSRIRGGLNWYDVRIGTEPLHGPAARADLLVALTEIALATLREEVTEGATVLYNGTEADGALAIDFDGVAKEVAGSKLYSNTVAAGAVFALLGYDLDVLDAFLKKQFKKKGQEVIEANEACLRKGAELARQSGWSLKAPHPDGGPRSVCDGATAIGQAAAVAGVKLVTAYPMTPGTATFTHLAKVADEFGLVVEQAEDEIAAVNMICGAAYAGVPALTTTSGGGFALMAEGLSLAGIMELPILIVIAQRPGPATGLPTRTGQQDLLFALRAGHGEFPRAIFAPGSVRQCAELTRRALETAHRFQAPVILLTDQFLQDLEQTGDPLPTAPDPIDRCLATEAGEDYARYAVTDSGVSPRAIPGGAARVVCDSDEHTADGHLTEDLDVHLAQQDKRMRKLEGMTAESLAPERHGPADAETLLICWGSTYGPCREAVDLLNAAGGSCALLHFAQLWPLNVPAVREAVGSRRRVVGVEGNQTGQLVTLLRSVGAVGECELLTDYSGLPFTGERIAERTRQ
ncbi:MAG TPA: 2-oxoacid:acceptor oxidoreductase subunit alpha [Phycisphaerae bacterium]|nr:2-oxoacid:acceptor oxidoreductase subunit alpha [Phycisphaerae bacterium]